MVHTNNISKYKQKPVSGERICRKSILTFKSLVLIFGIFLSLQLHGQLTTDNTYTDEELVQDVLVGDGVLIFNISTTGNNQAIGRFDGTASNIGLDDGIIMSTGNIANATGPNNQTGRSTNFGAPGDADLTNIIGANTFDAMVLEFDFLPTSDTIRFRYVFASEEYHEYVNSGFNDVFAFLLSGPNPLGGNYDKENIALIPGTTTPVSINNVNAGHIPTGGAGAGNYPGNNPSNIDYFFANGNGNGTGDPIFNFDGATVQYDGFTVVMEAWAHVIPCQTYHIKLAIADVADGVWDSAVFLEANSFGSEETEAIASFVHNAPVCDVETVDFLNTGSTGAGVTFLWDFGEGANPPNSVTENPSGIVYNSPGFKTVSQTVTLNCGLSQTVSSQTIYIYEQPEASFNYSGSTCINNQIDFNNTGSTGSSWSYTWDFGADAMPQISNAENPQGIKYSSSGDKTVTLTISNANCTETFSDVITIDQSPTADFTHNSDDYCSEQTVDFLNTGTTGANYLWDFGADATPPSSIVENPAGIIYNTPGIKTIELIATIGSCTDAITKTINIAETPDPDFTHNAPQCINSALNFNYTGTTGAGWSYLWNFGEGANPVSSTQLNPGEIYYSEDGIKNVQLTVSNGLCAKSITIPVEVTQTPVADFTNSSFNCSEDAVDFENTGTIGATYSWNFGAGATPANSSDENPTGIVYSTPGIKTVELTTSIGTCTDVKTKTINITETPAPNFTHNAPQCQGTAINFNYTGTTGTGWTYLWDFGENANPQSSTQQSPQEINFGEFGMKNIQLTVANGNCVGYTSQSIEIIETPIADFTNSSFNCSEDAVDFENTGTTGATYSWNFGAGATPANSSDENPTGIVYSTPGIKTVELTTSIGTCTDVKTKTINITETPAPNFTHNAPQCLGTAINFNYTGTTGTGWTYLWDFGENANPQSSTQQSPQEINFGEFGMKNIQLTVANGNCVGYTSQSIEIIETPIADFTNSSFNCSEDAVDFENTGTTGATYSWNFGAGATPANSTDEHPIGIVYSTPGIKTVVLTTSIGTCTDVKTKTINIKETPAPDFTHNAPQCQGTAINFNYTGTTGTGWTYLWDFGENANPQSSTQQSPQEINFGEFGMKNIQLTVTNGQCVGYINETIEIHETPVADFTSISKYCSRDTVSFENTGSTGATYSWSFGTGATPANSTDEHPSGIIYNTHGIKTIELTTSIGTCVDVTTKTINITETPDPDFTHNAPQCEGEFVSFNYTGTTGASWNYSWDFGVGSIPLSSSQQNPQSISFTGGGQKTVLLTVSNAHCSEKISSDILIHQLPLANAGSDTTICANASVQIGAEPIDSNSYLWYAPDGSLDNNNIANPIASPTGNITNYYLLVTDENGCQNRDTVNVIMLTSAFVNAGPDVKICYGDSVQIGMGLIEWQYYQWSPIKGLSDSQVANPFASPDSTTLYTIEIQYADCEIISDDVLVTVHQLPKANAGEDQTIAEGESAQLIATGGIQYNWTPEETLSNPGIFNPVAYPLMTTEYIVKVGDVYGCINYDSITIFVIEPSFWIPNSFTPNGDGLNDILYVRGDGFEKIEFKVFTRWGETVFISNNIEHGWDGNRQNTGEQMPQGAYIWSLHGVKSNGDVVSQMGTINLIR